MNRSVRHFFLETPVLRGLYLKARTVYHGRLYRKAAENYFINVNEFQNAMQTDDGSLVEIRTKDGLKLTIRRNCMDAAVLSEVFLEKSYVQGVSLPPDPVVVDIGGYIGDFALFAVKQLNARKVVACEPSPRNWELLNKNVSGNHFEDRIELENKAVTDGQPVLMNIDAPDRHQAKVSAYTQNEGERRLVPGISLADLMKEHGLGVVDLLKIDCEGGEYTILLGAPVALFERIRNIVFECHEIEGFETQLKAVKQRLGDAGYKVHTHGCVVYALRALAGETAEHRALALAT